MCFIFWWKMWSKVDFLGFFHSFFGFENKKSVCETPRCLQARIWRGRKCNLYMIKSIFWQSNTRALCQSSGNDFAVRFMCDVTTSWRDITWRCGVVMWRHITLWRHGDIDVTSGNVLSRQNVQRLHENDFMRSHRDVTGCHGVTPWRHMTSHVAKK